MNKDVAETYQHLGYKIQVERISDDRTMESAYTENDEYIGDKKDLEHYVTVLGLSRLQSTHDRGDPVYGNKVVNVGFNEEEQKWYGWSHRAMRAFGVGDKFQKWYPLGDVVGDEIATLDEAFQAATAFSKSTS